MGSKKKEPRSDAWWAGMPQERLDQIYKWSLEAKTETCVGGPAFAMEQLAADGIIIVPSQFSRFRSWYSANCWWGAVGGLISAVQERMPEATAEELGRVGDVVMMAKALSDENTANYVAVRSVDLAERSGKTKARQKDADLKLAERRVAVLEEKIARVKEELTKIVSKGGLSVETLKQIEEQARLL
jgi:hypothetical protein